MSTALTRTPVLVGLGMSTRHEEDYTRALEPLDLMLEAVRGAATDSTAPGLLAELDYIAVPRGRWSYRNPGGAIARAIGARNAQTVLANVGVPQQTLMGEACERIARGEARATLVVGGDAGYRMLRAQIAGEKPVDSTQDDASDVTLDPKEQLFHAVETAAGFEMPVGLYAIIESAYRARRGWSLDFHRDRLAARYSAFSAVAAANPHAWSRQVVDAATIREGSARNPMQAFPYTRHHCSSWNVDQGSALLFCSAARAAELGIPRSRWVYPVASTESSHMTTVTARGDLAGCTGAGIGGAAALAAGNLTARDLDFTELYTCFPIAVDTYADALGISDDRTLTVTGAMPFAGGPFNNYVLHATARAAELLRARGRGNALVSSVSGMLTKQGFGLWSMAQGPRGFVCEDVGPQVARAEKTREVIADYTGPATIAGYTVLFGRGQQPRGVAVVETTAGARVLTTTRDADILAAMQREEWVGRQVHIAGDVLSVAR